MRSTALATGQELQSPAHLATGQCRHQPPALDAGRLTLVGWADTLHLDTASRDESTAWKPCARAIGLRVDHDRYARAGDRPRCHGTQHHAHGRLCPASTGAVAPHARRAQMRRAWPCASASKRHRRLRCKRPPRPRHWQYRRAHRHHHHHSASDRLRPNCCAWPAWPRACRREGRTADAGRGQRRRHPPPGRGHGGAAPQARIGVLVEIRRGPGRCGVPPSEPALALVTSTVGAPGPAAPLRACTPTRAAPSTCSAAERRDAIAARWCRQRATRATLIAASGLAVPLVIGLGHRHAGARSGQAECLASFAGGLVPVHGSRTMHATNANPRSRLLEHALFIKTQVISRQGDRAVCDAGHKAMPSMPACPGGLAAARCVLCATAAGDEHGIPDRSQVARRCCSPLAVMLWLIPGTATTVNPA